MLHHENWRNFPRVDVVLQRRVFLVGPNASGKSDLLDVFRFLHDIVSIGGGFQSAVMSRGGVSRIRSLSARRYPDIAIRVEVGNGAHAWTYALRFSQDNLSRPVIKEERVLRGDEIILNRSDATLRLLGLI